MVALSDVTELLRDGALTRDEIRHRLNLSVKQVDNLIARLKDKGIVRQVGLETQRGPGLPAVALWGLVELNSGRVLEEAWPYRGRNA